jgi:hypothetical protein
MIRTISACSDWIRVDAVPVSPYVANQQSAGMLRHNTQTGRVEVYNGTSWLEYGGEARVGLTAEAQAIMTWAQERMVQDQKIQSLCAQHPGLQEAWEKFQIMKTLVEQSES